MINSDHKPVDNFMQLSMNLIFMAKKVSSRFVTSRICMRELPELYPYLTSHLRLFGWRLSLTMMYEANFLTENNMVDAIEAVYNSGKM